MTYVDTTNRDDYTATSGQTVFAYTFRILTEAELNVYDEGVLQTLTTHYTISGVGNAGGGNVTFVTGVTLDNEILIIRDTADTQNTDYTVSGAFPAESHETALDKLTMKGQDLDEKLGRALKFAITSLLSDINAPEGTSAADGGGKVWAWNSARTALELLSPTVIDAVSVIAVKGDMVQGDASGNAEKLAVGATSAVYQVVAGKIASVTNPILLIPTIADMTNATHAHADTSGGGLVNTPYIRLHDLKATTVAGGTFTAGAWQKRTVIEDQDTENNASVASSVITLEAGTYDCLIVCPAFGVDKHTTRLQNTSDTATLIIGNTARAHSASSVGNISTIQGRFTLSAQKTLEIQHRCEATESTDGFGQADSFGLDEIYTVAEFWKVV